jgi:hypothetical protein
MCNRPKTLHQGYLIPATFSGPKPGDFAAGSLRSRAAARAIVANYVDEQRREEQSELANLTEFERVLIEDCDDAALRIQMIHLAHAIEERARIFNLTLPTCEEIRHNRAVAAQIDRMTNGTGHSLQLSNPAEWNRLRAIAEENLLVRSDDDHTQRGRTR